MLKQHALGELENHRARRQPGLLERVPDVVDKPPGSVGLTCRQLTGCSAAPVRAMPSPSAPSRQASLEHPAADRDDQPVSSAMGMNVPGGICATRRMIPAQERLGATSDPSPVAWHRAGRRPELVALERVAQIALISRRSSAAACIAGSNSAACPRPRLLARYIARSALRSRSSAIWSGSRPERDADAGRRLHLAAVDHERTMERRRDPSATCVTSSRARLSSMRTANSSPPSRAAVSNGAKTGHEPARPTAAAGRRRSGRGCR